MAWDVLGGGAALPMTNVRNLGLSQWRALASNPAKRSLVPVTEFCERTPDKHQVGEGKSVKAELWFAVPEQPIFAIGGFWQHTAKGLGFTMVTCDPNQLVAPIHSKAMVTILHGAHWDRWLTGSYDDVVALQKPCPADHMTVRGPVVSDERGRRQVSNEDLPPSFLSGIEALSGRSPDDVEVHRDSTLPARLSATDFAGGRDIHLAPQLENHLPHEAWHVVQQKHGRISPSKVPADRIQINDDAALQGEADDLGRRAMLE